MKAYFFIVLAQLLSLREGTAQEGENIFKQNCAVCHQMGTRLVGPDLTGVNEKRSEEWLIKFIASSETLIRSGDKDAEAVYKEFNLLAMPDHPNLSVADIKAVIAYIGERSKEIRSQPVSSANSLVLPAKDTIHYTEADIKAGKELFTGERMLANGGISCLACHQVAYFEVPGGGLLAKDLTNVYSRMGDGGVRAILKSPPFPAMARAFKDHDLTEEEIMQLTAFFSHSDNENVTQSINSGNRIFYIGGISGLSGLLIMISLFWSKRKKLTVKNEIFSRQKKTI